MARFTVTLEQLADRENLLLAFHKAARDKSARPDVQAFRADLDGALNRLAADLLAEKLPYGRFRQFEIRDPKPRLISAACFEDRVFHHALMNPLGPVLERSLSPHSYACREGRGVHRSVQQVQGNLRRFDWYCRIDIAGYFPSISHAILVRLLQRRFAGEALLAQLGRVIAGFESTPGRGLPIGSLTSQVFANHYLDEFDRRLMAAPQARALVRYMDDMVWWCDSRAEARELLDWSRDWLRDERVLEVKPGVQLQPCRQGIRWCGHQISRGAERLSARRRRRYQQRRAHWEQAFRLGHIDSLRLQQVAAAVESITTATDSLSWRRENLRRHPPIDA